MHSQSSYETWLTGRLAAMALALALAGCSSELASFDDTYVPASVEENFPIKVAERPVQLSLVTTGSGLQAAEANEVARFARRASANGSLPVTVSYPASSRGTRQAAQQAAGILVQQGVPRDSIVLSPRTGKGSTVTLTFDGKVAETKPCGDWSENLRANQFNESGPNFGCAVQQNMAAMISNPGDIEHRRHMTPATSAAQNPSLEQYNNGTWTEPTADSSF